MNSFIKDIRIDLKRTFSNEDFEKEKSLKKQDAFSQILMIFVVMNTISTIYKWNYQSGATTFILIVLLLLNSNKLIKKGKRWKEI